MRPTVFLLLAVLSAPVSVLHAADAATESAAVPDYIRQAVADPARTTDTDDDAERKPGAVLAFAEVEPGDTVIEIIPGGGYWTRMLSDIVGGDGHVYEVIPDEVARAHTTMVPTLRSLIADLRYDNVSVLRQPIAELSAPVPADLVFTARNYHDYMNMLDVDAGAADQATSLDTQAFDALEPGGVFLVTDHAAAEDQGISQTDTLHRIEPAAVKAQATAAGFVFEAASDVLRNPSDTHKDKVFDPAIRGHTDQFVFRFRKPAD